MEATLAQLLNHIYELEVENAQLKEYIQKNCPPEPPVGQESSGTGE